MNDPKGWMFGLGAALIVLACSTEDCRLISSFGALGSILMFFSFKEYRNANRLRRMARELKGYLPW